MHSICVLCVYFLVAICILPAPFLQMIYYRKLDGFADKCVVVVLLDTCSLSLIHDDSMAIHLRFLTAIELFQHCNKYADHKMFHDAFLASISNTVLKGSGKENYSNVHYVEMTAVELLNFSVDK